MLAALRLFGMYPAFAIAFSTRRVMFLASLPPYLRLSAKIPSGPAAFPAGSSFMASFVSSSVHYAVGYRCPSSWNGEAYMSDQYWLNTSVSS